MKPKPIYLFAFLLGINLSTCTTEPSSTDEHAFSEHQRFIYRLTYVYQSQQEEPLPVDTFELLKTTVDELEQADPREHYRLMTTAYIMRAAYTKLQGKEPLVPVYLEKAEQLLKGKTAEEDLGLLASVYNSFGSFYSIRKEEIGLGLTYKLKELNVSKQISDPIKIATAYINIGIDFSRQGEHAKAPLYFDSAGIYLQKVPLNESNFVKHCGLYFNMGHSMLKQGVDLLDEGRFEQAQKCFSTGMINLSRAEEVLEQFPDIDTRSIQFYINQNRTRILTEMGSARDEDQLILYAESLLGLLEENTDRDVSFLSLSYGALAIAHAVKGECQKVKEFIKKGLEAQEILKAGSYEMVYNKFNYVRFLYLEAFALTECAKASGSHVWLEEALASYENNLDFIETLRRDLVSEGGEEGLNKTYAQYAAKASFIALDLYEQTGQGALLEKAFQFSEKSKAVSLLRALKESELAPNAPDQIKELAERETFFRNEITRLDNHFYQVSSNSVKNRVRDSLITTRRAYEAYITDLKNSSDEIKKIYYRKSYDVSVPQIAEIQSMVLDEQTALLEFQIHGKEAVIFVVEKERFSVERITIPEGFFDYLKTFSESLAFEIPIEDHVNSAYGLYRILLKKVLEEILPKTVNQLIIVPDKVLAEVVFENLVMDPEDKTGNTYSNLPYLLNRFSISYVPSLASYGAMQRRVNRRPDLSLDFLGLIASPNEQERESWASCSDLPLPELSKVAKKVAKSFPKEKGKMIDQAVKEDFYQHAPKTDILHFAMHGCFDASGSYLGNYLQFMPEGEADGRLTAGDILQYPLQTRLAVLASCNTGQGDLSRSEGLKSLARSFIMAGCPSVIATMNVVKDATTAEIMEIFYEELLKGASLAESLRRAKIKYYTQAPAVYAHPKYWANILMIGDPRPIY